MRNLRRLMVRTVCLFALLLGIWVSMTKFVHATIAMSGGISSAATRWISLKEIRSLQRYHGTNVLKIMPDGAYIWRDSRWVPVRKRVGVPSVLSCRLVPDAPESAWGRAVLSRIALLPGEVPL